MSVIVYVDDDRPNLQLFRRNFDEVFEVEVFASAREALARLARGDVGVVVSDQRMPEMTGVELLGRCRAEHPAVARVLLTAYAERELLLDAIARGHVHDYVLKPWRAEDLEVRLARALAQHHRDAGLHRAAEEADALRQELASRVGYGPVLGFDGDLAALAPRFDKIARSDSTVTIRGETGTGKELLARELHARSRRSEGPLLRTNCAALSPGLLESELFGHEAGAFTGAQRRRVGRFEQASGGTLFLDEIGDLSLEVQLKLLRVLQEKEIERVGSSETIRVDVRVVTATHRDLEAMVGDGAFREDLYHRIHVIPVHVPPLRERPADLRALAAHFTSQLSAEAGKRVTLSGEALNRLAEYDWPGNVRELRNVIERVVVLADHGDVLLPDDFSFDFAPASQNGGSVFAQIAEDEVAAIRQALVDARGSKARAARILGIPRTTLNDRIRRYGID